jgi:hypothetical protein
MAEKIHVFAIVRLDATPQPGEPLDPARVTVKEILPTLEEAEAEVARLNRLNADKGSVYFWQTTRYFPAGRCRSQRHLSLVVRPTREPER